jgi:hypothetical protein
VPGNGCLDAFAKTQGQTPPKKLLQALLHI